MRQLCSNGTHTLLSASYRTASKTRNYPSAAQTGLALQTSTPCLKGISLLKAEE